MRVHCFNQPGQHARLTRTRPVAWPAVRGFREPGKQPLPSTSPPAWPFTTQTPPGRQVLAAPLGGLPQGLAIPLGPACPLAADGACSGRPQDRRGCAGSRCRCDKQRGLAPAGPAAPPDLGLQGVESGLPSKSRGVSRRVLLGGTCPESEDQAPKVEVHGLLRRTYIFRCHFNPLQDSGHWPPPVEQEQETKAMHSVWVGRCIAPGQ